MPISLEYALTSPTIRPQTVQPWMSPQQSKFLHWPPVDGLEAAKLTSFNTQSQKPS